MADDKATITWGESPTLNLTAKQEDGTAFDLSSATSATANFPGVQNREIAVTGFSLVTDGTDGKFTIDLIAAQSRVLNPGNDLNFNVVFTISSKVYYVWFDRKLNVRKNRVT